MVLGANISTNEHLPQLDTIFTQFVISHVFFGIRFFRLNWSVRMSSAGSCLTPTLSFPHSHFRSIDPGLKEDTLEFLIKGVYGPRGGVEGVCLFTASCFWSATWWYQGCCDSVGLAKPGSLWPMKVCNLGEQYRVMCVHCKGIPTRNSSYFWIASTL